jgi:CRISPR system Cascade subunit CasE
MYLSKLTLNPRNRQVMNELARPYEMHRTLLSLLPHGGIHQPRTDDNAHGLLFRVEQQAQTGTPTVLVQSNRLPNWSLLQAKHDARRESYVVDQVEDKEIELQFSLGQHLRFRLRANPTKRLSAGKGNKGKRIGLYKLEEQIDWLHRKAQQHGFGIHSALPSRQDRSEDHVNRLELFSVQFDGILQVTDPERFLAAVQAGIGSGKAFGFGLLSLAPVR